MNRSLKYRVHEWAADRFSWVQYPNIRAQQSEPPRLKFAYQMPIGKRIDITLMSVGLLIVSMFALIVVGTLAWAFLSPVFGL